MTEDLTYESRMSDSDALMWTIEKDPLLRSTITAVGLLDGSPDPDRLTATLERATRLIPRLRQRVVGNPLSLAPPRWELDPGFDLGYHLRWVRAPEGDGLRPLLDLAQWVAMEGFDRARPLWEFYVVDGLADGRSALIQKIHHAVTDGVGSIKMALTIFDLEPDPGDPGPMPEVPEGEVLGPMGRLVDGLTHLRRRRLGIARRAPTTVAGGLRSLVGDPVGAASEASRTAGSVARLVAPVTHPLSPLMTGRSMRIHFDNLTRPLEDVRRAAKSADCRINDVFLAAVGGGFRRYHRRLGSDLSGLRVTMPINVRDSATESLAGNRFIPARFPIPVDIDDPVDRMRALRDLVRDQRAEPSLRFVDPLAGVLNRLPATLTTALFGSALKGVDLVASNVPGAPIPLYLAGAQVIEQYAFGPPSGAAANVTLLSWGPEACIGINVDLAAVTEPDLLLESVAEGFDEVLARA